MEMYNDCVSGLGHCLLLIYYEWESTLSEIVRNTTHYFPHISWKQTMHLGNATVSVYVETPSIQHFFLSLQGVFSSYSTFASVSRISLAS